MQAYKPQHTGAAALVLRALKAMGCATKQQLAQATGLSVMAAGTAVEHLMEKGRVLVRGARRPRAGALPQSTFTMQTMRTPWFCVPLKKTGATACTCAR